MTIYERIKELCKERKISVNKLEENLNIAKGSLCRIDVNKPSADKINKLAKFFGVSAEYLVSGKTEEKSTSENNPLNIFEEPIDETRAALCKNVFFSIKEGIDSNVLDEDDLISIDRIIKGFKILGKKNKKESEKGE